MTPTDECMFQQFQMAREMANNLDTVRDLRDLQQVRIALRHASYDHDTIDNLMHDAIEIAADRRTIKRIIGSVCEAACLALFLGAGYLVFAPDRAFAGDVQAMPPEVEWSVFCGAFVLCMIMAWLAACAIWPKRRF